jgi:hypothetical protein
LKNEYTLREIILCQGMKFVHKDQKQPNQFLIVDDLDIELYHQYGGSYIIAIPDYDQFKDTKLFQLLFSL